MMKKGLIKGRYGMVFALILLSALTGCADSKGDESTAAESMTESITESVTAADSRAEAGVDEERTSGKEDTAEKKEGDLKSIDEARNAAYRSALEEVYARHLFPDGTDYGFDDGRDISDNHFAVYDIDQDGKDELIIQYTTTFMAGMVEVIYDYDSASDAVQEEFLEFPNLTYYDNGVIEAGWSHNQGLAGDFWPYTLYRYDEETDTYTQVGQVDAWDKSFTEGIVDENSFPDEIDGDGDGLVFYVMEGDTYQRDTPVDSDVYNKWRDSYVGDGQPIRVPYMDLTKENIYSIR